MTESGPPGRRVGERRAGKTVDSSYLERAATQYLERFASTADNLERVLRRKARRRLKDGPADPDMLSALVADAVAKAVRSGLVDDKAFAAGRTASLARCGTSPRTIRAKLAGKGVGHEDAAAALADAELDEVALARRFAERRRLGPLRLRARDRADERDLATLCRQGFSLAAARAALAPTE